MKRLLVVLAVLVIGVAALGYYRGWFTFDVEKTPDGKSHVIGTVDNEKIEADKKRAAEKVHDLRQPSEAAASEKAKQP